MRWIRCGAGAGRAHATRAVRSRSSRARRLVWALSLGLRGWSHSHPLESNGRTSRQATWCWGAQSGRGHVGRPAHLAKRRAAPRQQQRTWFLLSFFFPPIASSQFFFLLWIMMVWIWYDCVWNCNFILSYVALIWFLTSVISAQWLFDIHFPIIIPNKKGLG